MEVEFITLGDLSRRIDVPATTLRNWTDQLEDMDAHYVYRNDRGDRIYKDTDVEIFKYIKGLKDEHGRKTTMRNIAQILADDPDRFKLRTREEVPVQEPKDPEVLDLLNQEDIKRLMESERVKQFIGVIISNTTENLRNELTQEIRKEVAEELKISHQKTEEILKRFEENTEKRVKSTENWIQEMRKQKEEERNNKGFFSKLFGK
ncbi:MerR family transcriptional regulator (plasmid) [Bacillus velezensis]|uniref:MerR family transcriptional regulator n=1 Tax=Bacillus velezensis TaxID=492670 RepID=UPI002023D328|nr:MerR family transcriptional regulator [Bacillus velezensis]URJ76462.1 MerR family transcriptional regulator [Bacillus velezensis]URJ80418.1 MerR family transcriptional regulator [Bacillus velezensis]